MNVHIRQRLRRFIGLVVALFISIDSVRAGITVFGPHAPNPQGITITGADGISYVGTSGITATGADGFLAFGINGITITGADGIPDTGVDGSTITGADGATYTAANSVSAVDPDGITITGADGITITGADGITITGADGTRYLANSVLFRESNGITITGADQMTAAGVDGITITGADAGGIARADGVSTVGANGITITGADGITITGADGRLFSINPAGITITGADGITITGADGITITGADGITITGADAGDGAGSQTGLQSLDPELALKLNQLTDDSNINAIVVYHHLPTDADIVDLQRIGIFGGTRYSALPIVAITGTRRQIEAISRLGAVRSIYGNRTLQTLMDRSRVVTGVDRVRQDVELTRKNGGTTVSGHGVRVAVLDTGLNATHSDLANRVERNVKLADPQSISLGFTRPANQEIPPITDLNGHGTFVAGVIAGSGVRSNGKFSGVAPGAKLVGLSAGDLSLFHVLAGFDYLLEHQGDLNVRVVNCSFSANTVFDTNDPVNIATKMLAQQGVNVVFSAGNTGPGLGTLNPYAVAPWVVSVGATDAKGRLANFSSRGSFGSTVFRPTLVAPGVNVISLRSPGLTGVLGVVPDVSEQRLSPAELLFYTTASGTSFSAPQVAGTIALMLEANPSLTPAQVRDILQRSATPLPPYYQHEVGAGMLNAHAAVLEAAFSSRRMGQFRAALNRGQMKFVKDSMQSFSGTVSPTTGYQTNLSIPTNSLLASVQIAWGPLLSTNDLDLSLYYAGEAQPHAQATTLNLLPALTAKRERVTINMPSAGTWRASVTNKIPLAGTPQPFSGTLETVRAQYAPLTDIGTLSPDSRREIHQVIRTFVMWPYGTHFRPDFAVTRFDLAQALVLGARVPQYLPSSPSYDDVQNRATMIFVESVQAAPGGPLFPTATPDATSGTNFSPDTFIDRLNAAVALVRAAGLRAEAEAPQAGLLLTVTDANAIPAELRGYVAVALARGLLTKDGTYFRPQNPLTRVQLAHAMVKLATLATE